jgi:DNA recombination-dependent growth factor C
MYTYALQIVQSVQLGTQSTVNTQKLLVHNSGQGKGAESVHASLVDGLGVLVLALELESEVISQMTALVVSAEQPERVGVPDLQRPEVKNAL